MVVHDLNYVFETLDVECKGYIEWDVIQEWDESIYFDSLDIDQIESAITKVCGTKANGKCYRDYFPELVKELERRHLMEERCKWDFRAVDLQNKGRIPIESALFLAKATHGDRFSLQNWKEFLQERDNPYEDISYSEIKLFLCNMPDFVSENSDEDYVQQENELKNITSDRNYKIHQELEKVQEDDATLAAKERKRVANATQLINHADNLLNRMDEIGLEALLEDDLDIYGSEGRAKERVTATELLAALKEKYNILREKLLLEMLAIHIGPGMWQSLTAKEKQEKLFQLKLKEEKIRKENKLEDMAIHLPGARVACDYNLLSIMGESVAQLEKRIKEQDFKSEESGLPAEEIEAEFHKKLDNLEQQKSSTDALLVDVEKRYSEERDILTKKLQGLSGYETMNAIERENLLFSLVQARLRSIQEEKLYSCGTCVGLTERIKHEKNARIKKDPTHQKNLSKSRVGAHKNRRSYDAVVVPPTIFNTKQKNGRVDLAMLLVQEAERRYALERVALLTWMSSKEGLTHRSYARKLNKEEKESQLSVLHARWEARMSKSSPEKIASVSQVHCLLEEAVALKLELIKEEIQAQDADCSIELLKILQMRQDKVCQNFVAVGTLEKQELENLWKEQEAAVKEGWFHNIAVVVFGIVETTQEEEELLEALNDKYNTLKDKLLLDAIMKRFGQAEWDKLNEQERQNQLVRMKLIEKKLRKEGKYDELNKLFGGVAKSSDKLNGLIGQNRQNYLDKLNERLRNRQRRIEAGEDPDTIEDDMIEEEEAKSTGNIFKDLDRRFDDEKDALLKRLRDENDRQNRERERQAELARLRMEARRAGREANFDSAALVLGLAERNKAALDDRLKNDRERQEKLAKERLMARRRRKSTKSTEGEEIVNDIEPPHDDIVGWKDLLLKELERKHNAEQNAFMDLSQDKALEDPKSEAISMTGDQRNERLNKLSLKRKELNFHNESDQEDHISILEIGLAFKFISKQETMKEQNENVTDDDVNIALLADLQQVQDEETRGVMESVKEKTPEEVQQLRNTIVNDRNRKVYENIATIIFSNDQDEEFVQALDKKYDTLLDKLALDALKKQLGDAEWANISEQERQRKLMKLRLQQKRLLKEGRLDEAARLLGDGFTADANLKKLMGENKKKYDEMLQERLRQRKEKLARGEPVDDLDEQELPEDLSVEESSKDVADPKSLLENLQKRYDDEKDALLKRLHGVDSQFMNERERQAELIRLKREQKKAQQEDKFSAAALVLGLAERNQAAAKERLQNDRARQEQLAKERLERMRRKKKLSKDEKDIKVDVENPNISLMEMVVKRHVLEQEDLFSYLQNLSEEEKEKSFLLSTENRTNRLQACKLSTEGNYTALIKEMAALKVANRTDKLKAKQKDDLKEDEVIISIMADLQQRQDEESSLIMNFSLEKSSEDLVNLQKVEVSLCQSHEFPNLIYILSLQEEDENVDEDVLINALESKYDTLKDKLILEALEKQKGEAEWLNLNEQDRQRELMKFKLEQKKLKREGRLDEAARIMNDLLETGKNVQALLGASKEEQERLLKERLEQRKLRRQQGLSSEEIENLEKEEDQKNEEVVKESSTGSILGDLEKNFEAEKEALLKSLKGADDRFHSERKRQLELARLRREARKAQAEEKFDAAALVLGMANSQQTALSEKIKNDRARQERLAKERLEARRNKRKVSEQPKENDNVDNIPQDANPVALQEMLLEEMEKRHSSERDFLMEIINKDGMDTLESKVKEMTHEERQVKMIQLKEKRDQLRNDHRDASDDQMDLLMESAAIKIFQMKSEADSIDNDAISVKLLADLQDIQDKEVGSIMKDLDTKEQSTIKEYIEAQQSIRRSQWNDNAAMVLLENEEVNQSAEDEIVNALKDKYDAMKEKVFMEALKAKFGEDAWNAMNDEERLEHLSKMKANDDMDATANNEHLESVALNGVDGLFTDDKKEDVNGANMVKELEKQFEKEKDAILSMLKSADTHQLNERERQLAIAKLRREKQRIKREEKYDSAALVMSLASQNQANKEASYENERKRQEQLARERIMARRQQRKESQQVKSEEEKLVAEEEQDKNEDRETINQLQREGTIALEDGVLNELEKKHNGERETLMDLVQKITEERTTFDEVMKKDHSERIEKLSLINMSRNKVKQQSRNFINSQKNENEMSEEETKILNEKLMQGRATLNKVLQDGLVYALACKADELKDQTKDGNVLEEAIISITADLQEKQTQENNALLKALVQMNEKMMNKYKKEERKARRTGWNDNVAKVVFTNYLKKPQTSGKPEEIISEKEIDEEKSKLQKEAEEELKQLEEKIEKEKEEKLKNLNESEAARYIDELKERENKARDAIYEQMTRQREVALKRLEDRRRKREAKEYEGDLAATMIANAEKRQEFVREKTMALKGAQKDSLEERLRKRREERKRKQEEEAREKAASATVEDTASPPQTQEETTPAQEAMSEPMETSLEKESEKVEADDKETEKEVPQVKKKKPMPPLPGGGLKREKTVVEKAADLSENRKKEMMNTLIREQTSVAMRRSKEKTRQEEMVRDLRDKRRQKMQAREMEAAAVIGLGQRQKTMFEDKKKTERERQIDQIRERVNRIKNERTAKSETPEPGDDGSKLSLVQENP